MISYKVRYGQTIYDVATQHYGLAEGVAQLLKDNADLTINSVLEVGRLVQIDETKALDTSRVDYFVSKSVVISNYNEVDQVEEDGFWITENNEYVITENGNKIRV